MDSLPQSVDNAIKNNDYPTLSTVFSSGGASSWHTLGQGEQRSLAAHFVKSVVSSSGFLPKAFGSAEMMRIMVEALGKIRCWCFLKPRIYPEALMFLVPN